MQESSTKRMYNASKKANDKVAGVLLSFGSMLFLLITTATEAIFPSFSFQKNAISDLAAIGTSTSMMEETAILVFGFCWVFGAYFLFRHTGRNGMLILNILPGVGFLLAGFSPENVNIVVHSAGALIAFPFGAVAAILSYRTIKSSYFKYYGIGLGILSLCATSITFLSQSFVGPCGTCSGNTLSYEASLSKLGLGLGGWESMIIFPIVLWLILLGGYLLSPNRSRDS